MHAEPCAQVVGDPRPVLGGGRLDDLDVGGPSIGQQTGQGPGVPAPSLMLAGDDGDIGAV